MAISGTYPCLSEANGILYLSAYSGGTQTLYRSQTGFSSVMTSATITGGSDAGRAAICKMQTSGRPLFAVVPKSGVLYSFVSKDDGATWSQVS